MTLRHSLFDKIFISFLVIFTVCFGFIVLYASNVTRSMLVDDRTEVLTNEAFLIADQTVAGYVQGVYTKDELQESLRYYSDKLNASIWVTDEKGIIYGFANADGHPDNPKNIFLVDPDFDIYTAQSFNGKFYNTFKSNVISVAIPIHINNQPNGMLLIHSTVEQLQNIQEKIVKLIYAPYLFMIIISFALLGIISGKVMRPIRKINSVAEQYSTGNFDTPMDIHSNDEIGQLASTLEYMASELAKLDEYRKAFISNISHDFRSPLTSIKGYIEAIQDGTIPPEKQSHYLDIVVQQTNRLTKLTSSLLELNNYDSYGIWLVCKDFDIVELVLSAINSFEGRCIEKQIAIRLNNHTEHSIVHADKTKIEQVIYNLLDNAIREPDSDLRLPKKSSRHIMRISMLSAPRVSEVNLHFHCPRQQRIPNNHKNNRSYANRKFIWPDKGRYLCLVSTIFSTTPTCSVSTSSDSTVFLNTKRICQFLHTTQKLHIFLLR